jgi:hypothetical protein
MTTAIAVDVVGEVAAALQSHNIEAVPVGV